MSMTPQEISRACLNICSMVPVIPVLVVNNVEKAIDLGRALIDGGLPVLEVTLRTENALQVIEAMATLGSGIVGAGTVLSPRDAINAQNAGAEFGVSPGATDALLSGCENIGLPLLPGASTASEAMKLLECGYTTQKFFPAEPAGGVKFLHALISPLPQITFCPTGGISLKNAGSYLALSNVKCVGGSWVAPSDLIHSGDWHKITKQAQETLKQLSMDF